MQKYKLNFKVIVFRAQDELGAHIWTRTSSLPEICDSGKISAPCPGSRSRGIFCIFDDFWIKIVANPCSEIRAQIRNLDHRD